MRKRLLFCKKAVTLHRVFHGIRFILRLVKIACREISNFFFVYFEKKYRKVLSVREKAVPLHSLCEIMQGFGCGNSSVGRAQPCQGWGREFESRLPLQIVLFLGDN